MGFQPSQDYPASRISSVGLIGQIGNLGSANGLAGGSANASVGGTNTEGAGTSSNYNGSRTGATPFALVKTVGGPAGMAAGGGASAPTVSSSSFSPASIQQDVSIDEHSKQVAQFTTGNASPASLGNNVEFPKSNGEEVELPVNVAFSKTASNVTIGGKPGPSQVGITDTLTEGTVNDLNKIQISDRGEALENNNKKIDGAESLQVPLYDPAVPQLRTGLEGNVSSSPDVPIGEYSSEGAK